MIHLSCHSSWVEWIVLLVRVLEVPTGRILHYMYMCMYMLDGMAAGLRFKAWRLQLRWYFTVHVELML